MEVEFSNSFFQQLQELVRQRKELEGKKFLGIFDKDNLRVLEELLKTDLGTHKRERRPFVGYFYSKWLFVCFLTRENHGDVMRVNLSLCNKKKECSNLQGISYTFYDRKNRGFYLYRLPKDLIKDYIFCGFCKDLEHIDKFNVIEVRDDGLQRAFN
ncbi:MAG: hypothetical protein GU346_06130 [Thermocrinis sp.]|jgi:hypothetical protein|nr:hypothetical protein [Thermocrinis sp.]